MLSDFFSFKVRFFAGNRESYMQYVVSKTFGWSTFKNKAMIAGVYQQPHQNL